jgi:hypothetical protein
MSYMLTVTNNGDHVNFEVMYDKICVFIISARYNYAQKRVTKLCNS